MYKKNRAHQSGRSILVRTLMLAVCILLFGCGESEKELAFMEACPKTKLASQFKGLNPSLCSCLGQAAAEIKDEDALQALVRAMQLPDPHIDLRLDKEFSAKKRSIFKSDAAGYQERIASEDAYMKSAARCLGFD
jgi:hypothetical protein